VINLDILVLLIKNWIKNLSIGVKGKGAHKDVDAFEEAKAKYFMNDGC
jgi:hypothetical protein